MTNLINLYTNNNSAIIPARKLKKEKAGYIIMPEPIKTYSIEKELNKIEEERKRIQIELYEKQQKKKSSKKWFLIIPSAILAAGYFFLKKK